MVALAAPAGLPSGQEDGLVGADETPSEASTISRENCNYEGTEPLPSHFIRNGNRLLAIAGDLRCREARHC
jgi:hypothetical protein